MDEVNRRQVGRAADRVARVGTQHLAQTAEIRREPLVDRRVERDLAGAVDHQIQVGGQFGDAARSPSTTSTRASSSSTVARLAQLLRRPAWRAGGPAGRVRSAPDRGRISTQELGVRKIAQQALEQRLSDEAGDAGDQQALARQPLAQRHPGLLARHRPFRASCSLWTVSPDRPTLGAPVCVSRRSAPHRRKRARAAGSARNRGPSARRVRRARRDRPARAGASASSSGSGTSVRTRTT